MLDTSHKIAAFSDKLSLWKEDKAYVSGSSQCFTLLSNFLDLRSIFCQHLSKFESKFTQFFGRIHQTIRRCAILSSSLPHRPLLNKKKKTIITLLAMIAWKESII